MKIENYLKDGAKVLMKNLYEILEVETSASQETIKSSYRRLAKKYHPDLNPNDENAAEKFKEVSFAYEVLSDEQKRNNYDRFGDASFENNGTSGFGFGGGGFTDLFEDIFNVFGGGFSSGYRQNGAKKGSDIEYSIKIDFNEAVFGVEKEISFRRLTRCDKCHGTGAKNGTEKEVCKVCNGSGKINKRQNTMFGTFMKTSVCDKCHGTGEIIKDKCKECSGSGFIHKTQKLKLKIPAGVQNGVTMKLRGEGNDGEKGGISGDLYILIEVTPHEFFERRDFDIHYVLPISFYQATLGAELEIPVLDGTYNYKIPAGTQPGTVFKLKGKGVKKLSKNGYGDLYFTVQIIVPKKISNNQKRLLEEFNNELLENKNNKGEKKNIFERIKEKFEGL